MCLIMEWSTMNGARLIYTERVVQTEREIFIFMDVLSTVDVNEHYS